LRRGRASPAGAALTAILSRNPSVAWSEAFFAGREGLAVRRAADKRWRFKPLETVGEYSRGL
jgi:hypothetical protein